jgi:hypothetical protein
VKSIAEKVRSLDAKDDVFCADFLTDTLILQSSPIPDSDLHTLKTELAGLKILGSHLWNVESLLLFSPSSDSELLPCGPYFLHQRQIYEAWKLYDDKLSSFQTCVVSDVKDPYRYVIQCP